VFLHEVAEGAAGRSWGVHVAELAGVPAAVVRRAGTLLSALEREGGPLGAARLSALPLFAGVAPGAAPATPPSIAGDGVAEALVALDPDRMSPREALDALYRLRELLAASHDERTQ
ncbi:MAG: DNA mismatch repair protein MutS, partial [Acetobacteraceae bacterium]